MPGSDDTPAWPSDDSDSESEDTAGGAADTTSRDGSSDTAPESESDAVDDSEDPDEADGDTTSSEPAEAAEPGEPGADENDEVGEEPGATEEPETAAAPDATASAESAESSGSAESASTTESPESSESSESSDAEASSSDEPAEPPESSEPSEPDESAEPSEQATAEKPDDQAVQPRGSAGTVITGTVRPAQPDNAEQTSVLPVVPPPDSTDQPTVWVGRQDARGTGDQDTAALSSEQTTRPRPVPSPQPHQQPPPRQRPQQPPQSPQATQPVAYPQPGRQPQRPPQPPQQPPQPPQQPPQPQRPSPDDQPTQIQRLPLPPQPQNQQRPPQPPTVEVRPAAAHARPMRVEPDGRQHPAAATEPEQHAQQEPVPAQEGPPPPSPPGSGRKRRRGLLLTGVAVVVLVAIAVVLALPDVSNRLALPWAPNAPQGEEPEPVAVTRQLGAPDSSAPVPTASGVSDALSSAAANPDLGTLTGSVVDPSSGRSLWNRDDARALTPASTTKLLTASAALLSMDSGKQLVTKVVEGDRPGSVVLVAGGDITLSSLPEGEESLYPGAAHLDDLVAQVKKAVGGDITDVQLDTSLFADGGSGPGWAPGDAPSTFAAPVSAAALDGGRSDPVDDHSMRVADPAGELAGELASRLGAQYTGETRASSSSGVLGQVESPPVSELVDTALRISDNTLAEVIGRLVAIDQGEQASFAGAARATRKVLAANGFDMSSVQLSDNSGLSPRNKVPAKVLSELLTSAAAPDGSPASKRALRPMLGGLPVAGGSGTLEDRYTTGEATEGRGWVRAKTGTLSGVNTLAGIVLDSDGHVLVFALMSSGAETEPAREALDDVASRLRGCGCR